MAIKQRHTGILTQTDRLLRQTDRHARMQADRWTKGQTDRHTVSIDVLFEVVDS